MREYPCPSPVPASWTAADPGLGRGPRCSLVAAAAAAVEAGTRRDSALAGIRLARVACVRAERLTLWDPDRRRIVADNWLVAFYADGQPDVAAAIHAGTGAARAFRNPRDVQSSTEDICARAL